MKKTFEIDLNIYPNEALKQAVGDFSDVGDITLKENTIVVNGESEGEIEEIFNELMNYVIGLVN